MKSHLITKVKRLILFSLLGAAIFFSCEAPRNNIIDPLNPENDLGVIEGTVQTFSVSPTGIEGVNVHWINGNILIPTDANGRFRIESIERKDGRLAFFKDGYFPDTLDVVWGNTKIYTRHLVLNKVPQLDSISLYTVVVKQFINDTLYIDAKTRIRDEDSNIDSVFVTSPDLNLRKTLELFVIDNIYHSTLSRNDLKIQSLEETIGLDFFIIAKDKFNREINVGNQKITRVINSDVTGQIPANQDSVNNQPFFLNWNRVNLGYDFRYMIELYRYDIGTIQHVFTQDNIPSDSISYQVNRSLSAGNYYWVIWIIDQFQNRVRSKPATFRIP